ncbi:glutathione transferase gst 23 [Phtheirospermum japonicum]|uniref:Probable glutathione S-transferase n=1 Tax=Phtheirospermum japonicum TaxID=374723 RepID=A0A830B8L8_9LAMI|nr:glutathione transferase gst 23 [Phtheirospermum japonicum]
MEKMSNNKSVKVVGFWVSLFTQRVRWALKLKGIEYEYIEEDIFNKSPLLLSDLNPVYGRVPVLIHDGKPLPESSIILEYIDQTWKQNPLLPQDPYERAQARFWARFADEKVVESAWLVLCLEGENQEKAVKMAIESLEKVEETLKGKKYFGGDTIGFLDLVMGFVSYWLPAWEEVASAKILDSSKFPAIAAWADNFINHPVIMGDYLPSKADIFTYYQGRRKELIPVCVAYGEKLL